ncbi:MAG: nuclear transport factor 2 family protein [Candidatus Binataceae bacterium]
MALMRAISIHRKITALLIAGVWFATLARAAYAAADPEASSRGEIRGALEEWTREFNGRDTRRVCSLFAPDLISNYQGQPEAGYSSLCAQLKKSLSDPATSYHYDLKLHEILVSGDMAAVRLTWTLTVGKKNQARESTVVDTGLDIFRRQPDGSWKIARFIAYPASGP